MMEEKAAAKTTPATIKTPTMSSLLPRTKLWLFPPRSEGSSSRGSSTSHSNITTTPTIPLTHRQQQEHVLLRGTTKSRRQQRSGSSTTSTTMKVKLTTTLIKTFVLFLMILLLHGYWKLVSDHMAVSSNSSQSRRTTTILSATSENDNVISSPARLLRRNSQEKRNNDGDDDPRPSLVGGELDELQQQQQQRLQQQRSRVDEEEEPTSSSVLLWQNKYDIVHVVQTRYMQYQPNLLHLGRARHDIFKSITLPSLIQQSNHEFLWMIRIDPNLDLGIRNEFITAIHNAVVQSIQTTTARPNVVVLASNENPEGFRSVKYNFDNNEMRMSNGTTTITTEESLPTAPRLVYGNIDTFRSYHEASQTQLVLETRLDADDALSVDFIENIQRDASRSNSPELFQHNDAKAQQPPQQQQPYYKVYCIYSHLEWQHYNPWILLRKQQQQQSQLAGGDGNSIQQQQQEEQVDGDDIVDIRGALLGMRTKHCVTSGLTVTYPVGVSRKHMKHPRNHHKIHTQLPDCRNRRSKKRKKQPCIQYLYQPNTGTPMALRVRTITSAGMANLVSVLTGKGQGKQQRQQQQQQQQDQDPNIIWAQHLQHSVFQNLQSGLWKYLPELFGINEIDIVQMRASIESNKINILKDALNGQCTHGHSCKAESKQMLKALLNVTTTTTTTTDQ